MKSAIAVIAAVTACLIVPPAAEAQIGSFVGGWVHEGTQQELVIRSSIQQRGYSMPGDFSLGGTTPGTVISTTPVPTRVRREMALIVREDGAFSWVTKKFYPESARCEVEILQQKLGRVSASGSRATFSISEGSERASRSCNDRVSESDRSNRTETYTVTRAGATLRISDGTTTWVFTRHDP